VGEDILDRALDHQGMRGEGKEVILEKKGGKMTLRDRKV
jgi:hypothetical protein